MSFYLRFIQSIEHDIWQSLDSGRPPIFNQAYVDCNYPQNPTEHDRDETSKQYLLESWAMRFAKECVAEVSARTLITDSPSYSTIMELDRKVRGFSIPEPAADFVTAASGTLPSKPQDKGLSAAESLGRFVMSNAREVILLYIHRSYFSQAIIENPGNPLNSTYTDSFLAAYRASTTILHTFKAQLDAHGGLIARFCPIWTYVFSAAMVFGTIVVRGPRCPMAASAMKELRDACTLFSKGAKYSRRAQKALPIATKMSEKAHNALILAQSEMPYELGQQWATKEKDKDTDEVAIFEGRSKFVTMKRPTDSSPEGSTKQTSPVSESQQQQSVDQVISHSYSSDMSGIGWTRSEQTQVMPSWDPPYSYATSQSAPVVPPPLTQQSSSVAQIQAQGRQWLVDASDPYQSTDLPGLSTHPDFQVYHPPIQRYDQPPNVPPLASSTVPTSYYELGSVHTHHHQNSLPSLHQYHEPAPQLPPIALAPPELAQLGLVAQESRLDQQWTSFMRQSGCFEDFSYKS
ncbi:hypothetical protein SCLCIDRAFT_26878 [Scleroderma citrinum Foug A]|uniref:Transcription factor domain-containing protein n=1 Tax=Scleroderma citrinum Foug A TaxID=1036808 RepID=A0A0C3DVC2_9AGAM|nr:hypothetical protein SCLCIDRAFT_26878 [Scleroderma citrinum Foug A]